MISYPIANANHSLYLVVVKGGVASLPLVPKGSEPPRGNHRISVVYWLGDIQPDGMLATTPDDIVFPSWCTLRDVLGAVKTLRKELRDDPFAARELAIQDGKLALVPYGLDGRRYVISEDDDVLVLTPNDVDCGVASAAELRAYWVQQREHGSSVIRRDICREDDGTLCYVEVYEDEQKGNYNEPYV